VIFPIAASASSEVLAAVILANVSGREVPNATRVIAVIDSFIPSTQPSSDANSPTIAVTKPIKAREAKKLALPPHIYVGGTNANRTFHPIETKCTMASKKLTSSISPSSSLIYGPNMIAFLNCPPQV
jgi:hypothetical protein